jgi:hypothetical protein
VTAPVSWNPPAPTAAPPLVVRPDRRKVRRLLAVILVANGVLVVISLAAALWASGATGEWWAGAALAVTLAGGVFQMVFHAYYYGRMIGSPTIAEIGLDGIRGLTTRWVEQAVPWSAVASVSRGWSSVVVTPVADAGPKVLIPTRAVDTDAATIRAAIAHFSGGRL